MVDAPSHTPRIVAITGACSSLGMALARALSDDPQIERILALDLRPPPIELDKLEFHTLDLTSPSCGLELMRILEVEKPDSFVHGGFLSAPCHDSDWAHELEDVGTMHVLDACAAHPPQRFVLLSSTLVYGAHPHNPSYLREDAPLSGLTPSRYINDRVRVEEQVARFAQHYSEIAVCSLRFAPILGAEVDNLYTRFLSRPLSPTVAGYDPLMQCVDLHDAVRAATMALSQSARGPFNIVGRDVLPYKTILAVLGRLPVPMPTSMVRLVGKVLWAARLSEVPDTLVDMLRYLCVADGERAQRELGFTARKDIRRVLYDFLGLGAEVWPASAQLRSRP